MARSPPRRRAQRGKPWHKHARCIAASTTSEFVGSMSRSGSLTKLRALTREHELEHQNNFPVCYRTHATHMGTISGDQEARGGSWKVRFTPTSGSSPAKSVGPSRARNGHRWWRWLSARADCLLSVHSPLRCNSSYNWRPTQAFTARSRGKQGWC